MLNKVISSVKWLVAVPIVLILTLLSTVMFLCGCTFLGVLKLTYMSNDYIISVMEKLNNFVNNKG